MPTLTLDGAPAGLTDAVVAFKTPDDAERLPELIESLLLPSPLTRLPGAYVSALPGEGDALLVLVMSIEPGATVGGELTCRGQKFVVTPTNRLAIYEVGPAGVRQVPLDD